MEADSKMDARDTIKVLKLEAETDQEAKELAFLFRVIKDSSPPFVLISRLSQMERALKAEQKLEEHIDTCQLCDKDTACKESVELMKNAVELRQHALQDVLEEEKPEFAN